jgi:hypothetical protein
MSFPDWWGQEERPQDEFKDDGGIPAPASANGRPLTVAASSHAPDNRSDCERQGVEGNRAVTSKEDVRRCAAGFP